MIDHVGIYGSRVAEGLSAFNVGLVKLCEDIYYPKISDKFDHGGSASLDMCVRGVKFTYWDDGTFN